MQKSNCCMLLLSFIVEKSKTTAPCGAAMLALLVFIL